MVEKFGSRLYNNIKSIKVVKWVRNGIRRGLFKSDYNRRLINADINGAIGILRKAKVVTDRDIVSLRDRGDLSSPRVFTFK